MWESQASFCTCAVRVEFLFLGGFPHSSVGKESACNAGDPWFDSGSGRSTGEGIGYPLQYSWASLVAQLVKNPPAMWETWVWSLGWEDPLQKGKSTHSSILVWRIPWTVHGVEKSQTRLSDFQFHFTSLLFYRAISSKPWLQSQLSREQGLIFLMQIPKDRELDMEFGPLTP